MKTVAFFNNKGGVGKTSLAYHLTYMYADLGLKVIVADFDPQANLSAMFLDDDDLAELWPDDAQHRTVLGAIAPLMNGTGDVATVHVRDVADNIGLIVGDLGLSSFEDELSQQWPLCLDGKVRAFRVMSAFYRVLVDAARQRNADLVLIDVGPNLGAINRSALIAAEHVVIPLAPDLFSLQGLKNLGPTLRTWRNGWEQRLARNPDPGLALPPVGMRPAGYAVLQHAMRLDRPVQAYGHWMDRIPGVYRRSVLGEKSDWPSDDGAANSLGLIKNYRSLMPMAMEARKPMFFLKPADGAIGAHSNAVRSCYNDFLGLAHTIADACAIPLPQTVTVF